MYKLLLFAGTTEGRELAEYLAGCKVQVTACVATEYGETLISPQTNLTVHAGRMDRQQMQQLMQQEGFDLVIDATHPYAAVVTQNIAAACQEASVPLYRCLRESEQGQDELEGYPHLLVAQDTEQAAHLLEEIEGNILLTTGSKELPAYRQVKGFAERFYPRVLPLANVVESCLALGIPAAHLIAMQGPFSQEMNLAMIRQWNISCLVTKESGKTGGVDQKLAAAKQAGISVLLIRRPSEQVAGWSLQALKQELAQRFGIRPVQAAPKPRLHRKRFPLFVSLYGKRVLVVGGGKIAARRARVLACFGCRVQVIAPKLSEKMEQLLQGGEQDAQLQIHCSRATAPDRVICRIWHWQQPTTLRSTPPSSRNVTGQAFRSTAATATRNVTFIFLPSSNTTGWSSGLPRTAPSTNRSSKPLQGFGSCCAAKGYTQNKRSKHKDGKKNRSGRQQGKCAGGRPNTAGDGNHPAQQSAAGAGASDHENHRR